MFHMASNDMLSAHISTIILFTYGDYVIMYASI